MDSIRQAIDLARASEPGSLTGVPDAADAARPGPASPSVRAVRLDEKRLEQARVVAHGGSTPQGRYYDMLRTQVLQDMDKSGWQFLAVTSPTVACGKTVTACNLALSIARLPERSVMLVDLDMHKPMVGDYLGLDGGPGLLGVLEERAALAAATVQAQIGPNRLLVLPGSVASSTSSEWMASQTMAALLQNIKREFRSRIVIFDLPPMLVGDDVISILPRMDAVLLVAGIGATSVPDIRECQKHLQRSRVVRVVVNKVTDETGSYYGYY
ncbi:MAG: CpsD/CapB family tyrosine-protein kinase [Xanthobacteraceae bacterium]